MIGLTPDITAVDVVRHGALRLTFADGLVGIRHGGQHRVHGRERSHSGQLRQHHYERHRRRKHVHRRRFGLQRLSDRRVHRARSHSSTDATTPHAGDPSTESDARRARDPVLRGIRRPRIYRCGKRHADRCVGWLFPIADEPSPRGNGRRGPARPGADAICGRQRFRESRLRLSVCQ